MKTPISSRAFARNRPIQRFCGRDPVHSAPGGGFWAQYASGSQQATPQQVEIGRGKERGELGAVLGQAPVAGLAVAELELALLMLASIQKRQIRGS